jgi:lysine 2,3-aminomutase
MIWVLLHSFHHVFILPDTMKSECTDSSREEPAACRFENLPELISPQVKLIISRAESCGDSAAAESLRRQFVPSDEENNVLPCELPDPLGAAKYQVTPRLVHQYKNRVLLLTTGHCFSNCRYCFRRCSPAKQGSFITKSELDEVCVYIEQHPEVQEVLLSGGDCLTGSDDQLFSVIDRLRRSHRAAVKTNVAASRRSESFFDSLLIRICTRAPVFAPERITPQLVKMFRENRPLWVIPHIDTPAEISERYAPETVSALRALLDAGIPVQSQTVLLRGVNDHVEILAELFHNLTSLGVKPGYLFQGDLVPGTSHFRVPVQDGIRLYESLRKELSGLSTPVYAVDLPGGGGKVNLLQADGDLLRIKTRRTDTQYEFTDDRNNTWRYPLF